MSAGVGDDEESAHRAGSRVVAAFLDGEVESCRSGQAGAHFSNRIEAAWDECSSRRNC